MSTTEMELQEAPAVEPTEPAIEPWPKGFAVRLLPGATLPKEKRFRVTNQITFKRMPKSNPKPRRDKTTVDTIARLYSQIDAAFMKLHPQDQERYGSMVGRTCGRFYIAATDGHRALFLPVDGEKREPFQHQDLLETGPGMDNRAVLDNPELHLAIERAMLAANANNSVSVDFGSAQKVTRITSKTTDEIEFDEDVTMAEEATLNEHGTEPLGFDGKYLLPVLGSWPLRLFWRNPEQHVVFAPADDSFRYVLMPLRLK